MRKIISILLLLMLAPMIVWADAAGPKMLGYEAIIINKDGVKLEYADSDKKVEIIPYNTKIYVVYESDYESSDDISVTACYYKDRDNCYSEAFTISIKDIAPVKEEVTPKDLTNYSSDESNLVEHKIEALVLKDGGVKMRKGPAEAYGVYTTIIPKNTKVNITYCVDRGKGSIGYCYVESGNYKGWIDASYDSCVYVKKSSKSMFFLDTTFYADEELSQKIFTIPAYTVVDEVYSGNKLYVKYNGQAGFAEFSNGYASESEKGYVLTTKNAELKKNDKVLTTIPAGEKVKIKYGDDDGYYSDYPYHSTFCSFYVNDECFYYVSYNGQEGLVSLNDAVSLYYESKVIEKKFDRDLKIYDTVSDYQKDGETEEDYLKRHETGEILPANTSVTSYNQGDGEEIVKYNGKIVRLFLDAKETGKVVDEHVEDIENTPQEEVTPIIVPENNEEEKKSPVNKAYDTIIYAVTGAVLACVTAAIIIIIVNSKKKDNTPVEQSKPESVKETPKEEETKEEVPKETENKETANDGEGEKKE